VGVLPYYSVQIVGHLDLQSKIRTEPPFQFPLRTTAFPPPCGRGRMESLTVTPSDLLHELEPRISRCSWRRNKNSRTAPPAVRVSRQSSLRPEMKWILG